MKILYKEISCCSDCPHNKFSVASGYFRCFNVEFRDNETREIKDLHNIKDSCPLPDKQDNELIEVHIEILKSQIKELKEFKWKYEELCK